MLRHIAAADLSAFC